MHAPGEVGRAECTIRGSINCRYRGVAEQFDGNWNRDRAGGTVTGIASFGTNHFQTIRYRVQTRWRDQFILQIVGLSKRRDISFELTDRG